jgi:tRNA(Ile)-lysidine synthase
MKEHLSFEESISYSISYHQLLAPQERVLVALSGGADSVALLRVLLALGYVCEAAHCNFHLRAADSDLDAAFVSQLCATLNVKLHNADFDTKKYAADNHVSIEMAARDLRYAFFNEICAQQNIQKIAVGHHEEDCVETVLLNLTRGTGIRGLTGIHFVNGNIIRPMLGVDRTEIEDYLSSLGQDYVTDKTNMIDDVARNQIRLNVIPCLKRINPSVSQAIYSASRRLNAVCSIYESAISEAKARVMCNNVISLKKIMFGALSGDDFI